MKIEEYNKRFLSNKESDKVSRKRKRLQQNERRRIRELIEREREILNRVVEDEMEVARLQKLQ